MVVNLRPFYLPREFSNIFVINIYIPEEKNLVLVREIVEQKAAELGRLKPDALIIIAGDVNQCSLNGILPNFFQYVNKPTRGNAILDHVYCNVKNAFKCKISAAIGKSDHDVVHLTSTYTRRLNHVKSKNKVNSSLSDEGAEKLNCIFQQTY